LPLLLLILVIAVVSPDKNVTVQPATGAVNPVLLAPWCAFAELMLLISDAQFVAATVWAIATLLIAGCPYPVCPPPVAHTAFTVDDKVVGLPPARVLKSVASIVPNCAYAIIFYLILLRKVLVFLLRID
jgi:hypothetical protein